MRTTSHRLAVRALSIAASLLASTVNAADAHGSPIDEPDLSEVLVTAEKIPEPLRLVPLSVQVLEAKDLERAGILDFDDLPQIAPSLTISKTTQPANNSINIRGIGTYAFSIAVEPSVSVVVDDIPLAFQPAAFTALVDVSQIEVLRGPQSTLFGKASNAGVIRITTAPVSAAFTGRLLAMTTDDHEQRLQGTVSGPINSELGYRLSANASEFRGTLHNQSTGKWLNGQSDVNLRGKLEWLPTSRLSFIVSPFWTRTDGTCCTAAETFVPAGSTTGSAATGAARIPMASFLQGVVPGPDNRQLRMDVDARGDARHAGSGLRMEYGSRRWSFLSLTSYEDYALHDLQDTDSTDVDFSHYQAISPPGGSANGGAFDVTSRTQEFRATFAEHGGLQFVGGAYWSDTRSRRFFVRGSNSLDDYSVATPPAQLVRPVVPTSLPTTNDTSFAQYRATATAENLAAFGQGTWSVFEHIDVLAGIRRGREKITYTFVDQVNGVAYGVPQCSSRTPSGIAIQTCNTDTATTGRLGLRIRPNQGLMMFATYSRGRKGLAYDLTSTLTLRGPAPATSRYPGLPLADVVAGNQPVPAEQVGAYEVGFKQTIIDDRWILNVTAYRMAIRDLQAQSRDLLLNQNVLNSVGRVTSRGVEAESSARLGRWALHAAGTYGRAAIDAFPNASCYRGQTAAEGCVAGVQNLAGRTLPNAPRWSTSLQAQYAAPATGQMEVVGTMAYRWLSSFNGSLLQDPAAAQSSYGILNVSAGVRSRVWQATLFVNNLFDRRFRLNGGRDTHINNPAGSFATNWRPAREAQRSMGIRLAYEF